MSVDLVEKGMGMGMVILVGMAEVKDGDTHMSFL